MVGGKHRAKGMRQQVGYWKKQEGMSSSDDRHDVWWL